MTSVPGVGIITGAQILARLGDPARFRSLAGAVVPLAGICARGRP
jgi:transposase